MIDLFDFVVLSSFMIILPLITDFLNSTFPNAKIGRLAQEIVGIILVFFIVSLIFAGVSLWYTHFLPFYFTKSLLVSFDTLNLFDILKLQDVNSITFYGHIIFTTIIVINLYYYYYQTIVSDNYLPKISKLKQSKLYQSEQERIENTCQLCNQSSNGEWSSKIKSTALPPSHHCRICKRCICLMDHHCPFASNCIGINNHHYFILFIIFTVISLGYACLLSFYPYYYCVLNFNQLESQQQLLQSCINFDKYSFIFLCCCLILFASFGILLFQSYLIITNSKTVQLLSKLKKSNSFKDWFIWLFINFKNNASFKNIKNLFSNFKFYNLIIPYYKKDILIK